LSSSRGPCDAVAVRVDGSGDHLATTAHGVLLLRHFVQTTTLALLVLMWRSVYILQSFSGLDLLGREIGIGAFGGELARIARGNRGPTVICRTERGQERSRSRGGTESNEEFASGNG